MPPHLFRSLRATACAAVCLVMVGGTIASAYADPPDPDQNQRAQARQAVQDAQSAVGPVQAQYDLAQRQLADLTRAQQIAAERYDGAVLQLQQARRNEQSAAVRLAVANAQYERDSTQLGLFAASAYQGDNGLGTLSVVLEADGPEQLAATIHMVRQQGDDLSSAERAARRAERAAQGAEDQAGAAVFAAVSAQAQVAAAAQAAQAAVAAQQSQTAVIDARLSQLLAQLAAAQHLSVQLEQEHQQAVARRAAQVAAQLAAQQSAPVDNAAPAWRSPHSAPARYPAGAAAEALAFAYAQLGKPYVWGGTGPDSYDCSGLTMRAWQAAGVYLPHFAAYQYQASHPISYSELKPGDLLFWATDPNDSNTIYHEAIYIGGQQMIQAPRSGEDVEISNMWMWGPIQFYARPD